MSADISVLMPARNEGARLVETIMAIAQARVTDARLEFIIADDQSDDDTNSFLRAAADELLSQPRIDIRVSRLEERHGVPRARNHAASLATAEILFITDAHVRVSPGFDALILDNVKPDRMIAGAITEANTPFVGYGCRLVVPFMGTYWNREPLDAPAPVQIAACPATAMTRALFNDLGGYDPGMMIYGAAEPEFSVRAWLHGAEVWIHPDFRVEHRFKPKAEREAFIGEVRPYMVHNSLRFGLMYLSEDGCMQLLRYQARKFPALFGDAIRMVEESDVWARREWLELQRRRPFEWFVQRFDLKDQIGGDIL
jgi:glycosyltransferase involved in cell wall biosynthesis